MLLSRLFQRKVMACFFAFSITIGVSPVTMQIAVAQETKQVLYPERGYWRIIDKTGKFVFEKRFERQPDIQEKDMLAAEYSPSNRYESDLHYFSYDFSGKRLRALASGPESPCWEDGTYSEGLTSFKADGFFGYLDENGKKVIPAKFRYVGPFRDGYALVGLASGAPAGVPNNFAIIDRTGQILWTSRGFTQKLNDVNMAVVQVGARYFAVQKLSVREDIQFVDWFEGDELYCSQLTERLASRTIPSLNDTPRKSGIALRKDGTYREANQEEVVYCYSEGLGVVKRDGRWQYVDSAGQAKLTLAENTIRAYPFNEGLAVVQVDCSPKPPAVPEADIGAATAGFHGRFNHNGLSARSPGPFLYGVIDKSGVFVVPPKYSLMGTTFADGLLKVGQGDDIESHCGYINRFGEVAIPLIFNGGQDFHNDIAAVYINEPGIAKRKADELSRKTYLDTCKKLIASALQPFYSVANLRLSITPGAPLIVCLEKWAGPSKLRERLLTALAGIDLPALPAAFVDQPNLEFSASPQHGVVVAGSPQDPFNAIKARLVEEQTLTKNISLDEISTEMLESKWQSAVAWYDWPDVLAPIANALTARYEKGGQAKKLQALEVLVKELSGGAGKSHKQYVYNALSEANKLYQEGKIKEAGEKYQKAASFFDGNLVLGPDTDWPPISLTALYNYSCFLASQKQYNESNSVFDKVLADARRYCDTAQSLVSQDHLDTYLELIRQAQPEQYLRYRAMVKEVKLGGMHATGFIDKSGKVVIAPNFKTAKEFKGGLAAVETVRGWGYVDKSGAWIVAPTFKTADNFGDGLAPVAGKKQLFPLEEVINDKPLVQYIDTHGKVAIAESFAGATPFVGGLAYAQSAGELGVHYIDKAGKKVSQTITELTPIFDYFMKSVAAPTVGGVQDNYFVRMIRSGPDKDGQYTFLPDDVSPFAVQTSANELRYGYRNAADTVILEPQYLSARVFTEGLAGVEISPGKCGFIDKSGTFKIPAEYTSVQLFRNGLAWVNKDSKWFLINQNGEVKSDRFDRITTSADYSSVLANKSEQQFFFSDQMQGLDVTSYSMIRPFHEGLAAVEKDNRWGFIDTSGKLVVPTKYGTVGDFSEGLASAYFP